MRDIIQEINTIMDVIEGNSKYKLPKHKPIRAKHESRQSLVEPKYADVTAWRHYYEYLHIYKSSLSWLFANEYYRMKMEGKV